MKSTASHTNRRRGMAFVTEEIEILRSCLRLRADLLLGLLQRSERREDGALDGLSVSRLGVLCRAECVLWLTREPVYANIPHIDHNIAIISWDDSKPAEAHGNRARFR